MNILVWAFLMMFLVVGFASFEGMAANDGFRVGDPFPSIQLPSLEDGGPVSAADFRGRKTVLHIWASW